MPKSKPNKGLLKRIKITKNGKVKFSRAFGRHLRSGKSGTLLQSYRRPKYATAGDARRVRAMLFMPIISGAKGRVRQAEADASSGGGE